MNENKLAQLEERLADTIEFPPDEVRAIINEVRRLRAVLAEYADRGNWQSDGINPADTIWYGRVEGEPGYTRAENTLREDGE